MGISRNHLHAVLQRADHSKSGTITYEQFLETVSSYRLNTEQASKIKQIGTALAYAEEFTCTPPKLFIAIGKVLCYSLNPNHNLLYMILKSKAKCVCFNLFLHHSMSSYRIRIGCLFVPCDSFWIHLRAYRTNNLEWTSSVLLSSNLQSL